jgi:hypothetical protein
MMNNDRKIFPRKLSSLQKELLFSILPENKPGYKYYRDRIEQLFIIGEGRFGGNNFILGKESTVPDMPTGQAGLSISSSPVFASGTNIYREGIIDITIHEEADEEVEFDISPRGGELPANFTLVNKWNYSEWIPGNNDPKDNSSVREIVIIPGKFLLAVAPAGKKIWLHDYKTGVNHLIPISNFYNELMRTKNIRDVKTVLNPNSFFDMLDSYSDREIISAFVSYNKYMKKFDINFTTSETIHHRKKRKSLFQIFKRG